MNDPDYDQMARDAENGLFTLSPGGTVLRGVDARRAGREMVRRALADESPLDEEDRQVNDGR